MECFGDPLNTHEKNIYHGKCTVENVFSCLMKMKSSNKRSVFNSLLKFLLKLWKMDEMPQRYDLLTIHAV